MGQAWVTTYVAGPTDRPPGIHITYTHAQSPFYHPHFHPPLPLSAYLHQVLLHQERRGLRGRPADIGAERGDVGGGGLRGAEEGTDWWVGGGVDGCLVCVW